MSEAKPTRLAPCASTDKIARRAIWGRAMQFTVLTIFPEMFPGPLAYGVVGRALARGLFRLEARDLRDWAPAPHHQVDDVTFGGGPGMVLKPEPLFAAVAELRGPQPSAGTRVVLLDPGGRRFDQSVAREYAALERLVLVCGRYEGVDGRVRTHLVDEELSIGDYVVSGGEVPALAVIETTARLVPGVVGDEGSVAAESFAEPVLDYPHYTRPAEFNGLAVPEVLLSGDHARIAAWRRQAARERTARRRPDLLEEHASPRGAGGNEARRS